uniref:RNA-directed DNA polymerase n=1 Tax=Caenorhabditis japonica TaxID=281687 RepID=A0A8R1DVE7_CAEJA
MEFNIKIVFLADKANSVANALRGGGCPPIEAEEIETAEMQNIISEIRRSDALVENALNSELWLDWLKEEEGWKELIQMLESGKTQGSVKIPGLKKEVFMEEYMLVGNFLRNSESEEYNRRVVPLKARHELIKQAYEGCWAAHFGTEELWRQLSKRIFWPKMRAHIENVVKGCPECICTNDQPKLTAPLTPYQNFCSIGDCACDLIDVGIVHTRQSLHSPQLLICSQNTQWQFRFPIKKLNRSESIHRTLSHWRSQFTKLMKIEHIMTKGYNSRANGAVERFNKTLMHTMKKRTAVPFEWDDQVAFSVYAYNNSAHSTTGESPMFLMCGRDSMGPLEMAGKNAVGINYSDVDEYKCLLKQKLIKVHKIVKEHADKECERHKRMFDQKHKTNSRQYPLPGSRVLVEVPSEKLGVQCPKLVNKWRGPYRVVACSNNSAKVVPILRKMGEILEIPFDNLRIIPPQMDDILIKTVKGRAKMRNVGETGLCCDEVSLRMSDDSDDEPVIADSQQQKLQTEVNTEKLKKTGRPKKAKKEDSYESYEAKDIKCFLEYVENAPILWDASIDNSHRKEFKWHHYEEIEHVCRKFMPKGRRIGETAERLFVELKRDYDRHLRKKKVDQECAYVIGSTTHLVKESMEDLEVLGENEDKTRTPKRIFEELDLKTPKRQKKIIADAVKIALTNQMKTRASLEESVRFSMLKQKGGQRSINLELKPK